MKKIFLAILLFVSLFVITGCRGSRELPQITDPEGNYLTATEDGFTYTLTNLHIYEKLKEKVGMNMLLDMVDRDLLKSTKKDGVSYWDKVSEEDINKELESDIFPNEDEKDKLTEAEKEERRNDYLDKLFVDYGLIGSADVSEFYHLTLSKNLYAKDQLVATYAEEDFEDSVYESYFNTNYKKSYYSIIVSYESIKLYEDALKQLGIKISNNQWLNISDSSELSELDIVKAYIKLYNMNNAHKLEEYPTETLTLNLDQEYSIVDGEVVFDLSKIDMLHYTHEEITSYESQIQKLLDENMTSYPEGDNWYTNNAKVYKQGSSHSFVLKIAEEEFTFEDVKGEIREEMLEAKLTNAYINTKLVELRAENNLVIYDQELEELYVNTANTYKITHELSKKANGDLVAETSQLTYSADELFEVMNRDYGFSVTASELEYIRFLVNTNLNTIYDYSKDAKNDSDKVIDATRWTVLKKQVEDEKSNFEDNIYEEYGYPKSFGWENFLKEIYGVDNEQELIYYYLYLEVRDDYTNNLSDLKEASINSDLWKFYEENMIDVAEDFYSVKGVHLLITVYDEAGRPVDPENWTETQVEYAEELYRETMDYLKTDSNLTYIQKLQEIQDAFNKAPRFLPGITQTTDAQQEIENINYTFNDIEISKYKTAGLRVKYEDLGQFTNGKMVEEFDNAVRAIWQADPTSKTPTVYGLNPDSENVWTYLETVFGYHVYINLESFDIAEWEEGKAVPTLAQIILYLSDSSDKKLSAEMKTAIKTYYEPIFTELTGSNNVSINVFTELQGLDITFSRDEFTNENFDNYLSLKIESLTSKLKYK